MRWILQTVLENFQESPVRQFRSSLMLVCLTIGVGLSSAMAQVGWHVLKTFHVGGEGGWDYVTVDAPNHRLFVTRTTHTMSIDTNTGKVLGDIRGQIRSHGVALVPRLNRGFITDGGGTGSIIIFDLKTYAVLGRIPAVPDADGIIYDTKLDQLLAVSGDGGVLMAFRPDINPEDGKLDASIKLGGAPEFLASDGTGRVYVNLKDKDVVAVVDLQSRRVQSRWPVAPGSHPVGMAFDAATHRLFIGCRNPQRLIVMNSEDGAFEASLPISSGVDATLFHEEQAFASCGSGSLDVASLKDGKWQSSESVKIPAGARTMGLDSITGKIYLPTAELMSIGKSKLVPKPDTFEIIEVGRE